MATLTRVQLPEEPGVYALYRAGKPVYVGKAANLRQRVWSNHSGRGASLTGSALRRNVAEHLEISTAAEIKARRYVPTPEELAAIRAWLDGCEVSWQVCESNAAAVALEVAIKSEYKPPLTKI